MEDPMGSQESDWVSLVRAGPSRGRLVHVRTIFVHHGLYFYWMQSGTPSRMPDGTKLRLEDTD